jgi:hypothetical protein
MCMFILRIRSIGHHGGRRAICLLRVDFCSILPEETEPATALFPGSKTPDNL